MDTGRFLQFSILTIDGRRPQYYFHFSVMAATPDSHVCREVKSTTDTIYKYAPGASDQPSSCTNAQALLVIELGTELPASSLQPPVSSPSLQPPGSSPSLQPESLAEEGRGLAIVQEEACSQSRHSPNHGSTPGWCIRPAHMGRKRPPDFNHRFYTAPWGAS